MQATQAHTSGDLPRAEYLYCQLVAHDETHPVPYFGLGTLYAQMHMHGRAITFLKKALELEPKSNGAMENLATVYRELEQLEQSRQWRQRAIDLARTPMSLSNMAGLYINTGNPAAALPWADEALALEPGFAEAGNHRALALLELGRYEEGWAQYDSRLDVGHGGHVVARKFHRRPYTVPMWKGEPVKLLAIHGEQGLGDEILFLTCLKQLRERYEIGAVVIECAPRLVTLLGNSLGVPCYGTHDELVAEHAPQAYLPMGSMPRFIWPVVPNAYLKPNKLLKAYYKTSDQFRIGLSWFGGSLLTHGQLRNAPLEEWKQLLELPAEFISLQYGPRENEAKVLGIAHDAERIADLDILAALIASCDLVVSVCNTTVHMAGALGVPCLCLVPSKPAWRYGLTGDKMVWYDSVRLLRQAEGEAWASVMERAREAIRAYHGILPNAQRATA